MPRGKTPQEPLPGLPTEPATTPQPDDGTKPVETPEGTQPNGTGSEAGKPETPVTEPAQPAQDAVDAAALKAELQRLKDEIALKDTENVNLRRGMDKSFKTTAELKREMSDIKEMLRNAPAGSPPQNEEALDEKAMAAYGMTSKQLKAIYEVSRRAAGEETGDLKEMLASQVVERERETLRTNDPDLKVPEVEETFNELLSTKPYRDRMNPKVIRQCAAEAKAEHFNLLFNRKLDAEVQKRMDALKGNPQTPPPAVKATPAAAPTPQRKSIATEEELARLKNLGLDTSRYEHVLTEEVK